VSERLYALYARMLETGPPLVAALDGPAVGGGAQLAVACDVRVAGPRARLRFPGPGHGLAIGAWALPSLVGRGRAMELCLSMRWVGAEEALRIGLVDRVAEDAQAAALDLAESIAALDPDAVRRVKRVVGLAASRAAALAEEDEGNRHGWSGSVAGLERPRG
jgi:enoyl-CoA hydratase